MEQTQLGSAVSPAMAWGPRYRSEPDVSYTRYHSATFIRIGLDDCRVVRQYAGAGASTEALVGLRG